MLPVANAHACEATGVLIGPCEQYIWCEVGATGEWRTRQLAAAQRSCGDLR
jgi:hypothetical protein